MKNSIKVRLIKKKDRINSFKEVSCGYNSEEALAEASRCLMCKNQPCVSGCPVNVPIPTFIKEIIKGDLKSAYAVISTENAFPSICGRVCPQEKQCELECVRGVKGQPVAIGRLERFVGDNNLLENPNKEHKIEYTNKVAIVGSGPAGLACAAELIKYRVNVDIYECLHDYGGVLRYGIPEFRLPKNVLDKELKKLIDLGVTLYKNVIVGKSITINDLFEDGYSAIFIGTGAGLPRMMKIDGEDLNGVYSANEYLTRVNLMNAWRTNSTTPIKIPENLIVVGGGNVALDVARVAKRLGTNNVKIVYRRSMDELPARYEEVSHAIEEDIDFCMLTQPIKILGDKSVTGLECVKMELGEKDSSGRRRPIEIEDSNFVIKAESVVIAIGQTPNPLLTNNNPSLCINRWGGIIVDEDNQQTSLSNVYAGGDAVTGAATVISAMGAGKKAAKSIIKSIKINKRK